MLSTQGYCVLLVQGYSASAPVSPKNQHWQGALCLPLGGISRYSRAPLVQIRELRGGANVFPNIFNKLLYRMKGGVVDLDNQGPENCQQQVLF